MAINATIQVRRGLLKDFDPTKMLPGEWAVSIDASTSNQIVWMCFAPGVCKRMGTYEDFKSMISQANGEIIEELRGEFEAILADVESVAKDVSTDKEEVLVVKSEILNTYIPQIQNYVNTASTHAKNAKTSETNAKASENNAKVSETNAEESAEEAKAYAEQALSTTPDGYNQMVLDVDLLKNAIIQTSDRTLYGSKEGGIKLIGISGASEQGENPSPDNPQEIESVGDLKNLLEVTATSQTINGVTFTVNEDKSITVNGTPTDTAVIVLNTFVNTDKDLILTGCPIGGSNSTYKLSYFTANGQVNDFGNGVLLPKTEYTYEVRLVIYAGVTANNLTFKPMIRKASVQNAEYKPYGYSLGIKAEGKNQFNNNVECWENGDFSHSGGGIEIEATTYIRNKANCPIRVKRNTDYYFSTYTDTDAYYVTISKYQNDGAYLGRLTCHTHLAFNSEGADYVKFAIRPNPSPGAITPTELLSEITFQLEEGTVSTPYEPYRSKSITIPLNEPLRGIGEVKDEVVCQDGVWGVLRWIYKKVLDGTAVAKGFTNIGTVNRVFFTIGSATVGTSTTTDFMTTSFQKVADYTLDEEHCYLSNGDLFVFINADKLSSQDASGVSNWLTDNNVECNFIRATPTFEPFTDQTPFYGLESFDTVTIISTDSEVEPSIELKFAKTEGGAVTLLNYNQTNLNRIAIAELTSAVLDLNQE